jgi:hypothetical protein
MVQPKSAGKKPSPDSATIAAGAAFRVDQSGQITDAQFRLQTQGISPELAAKLIARLAANQRQSAAKASASTPPVKTTTNDKDTTFVTAEDQIADDIHMLYADMRAKVPDSPFVTDICLRALRQARLLSLTSSTPVDLVNANNYLEMVRAKLERSGPAFRANTSQLAGIVAWTIASFLIALPLAALPWLAPAGTLGTLRIPGNLLPLLAALGWGTLGGVTGTLYHLPWFVQLREYDQAYFTDYISRPPKGFLLGAGLYVVLALGGSVLNVPILPAGIRPDSPLLFVLAVVAGFKQDIVLKLFDNVLRPITKAATSN